MKLRVFSGGAAQGLVGALAPDFQAAYGVTIDGAFTAVGALRDRLVAGEAADIVILSRALIDELAASGHVDIRSAVDIGIVLTGIAVRAGDAIPDIVDADTLRAALAAADAVYLPDPARATAGIHFAGVIARLGLTAALAARMRPFPNGATAMRELAAATSAHPIGCTQITEILATPGLTPVGPLPKAFELATVYTAAVTTRSAAPKLAGEFVRRLAGDDAHKLRHQLGFAAA